jgi:hypothetical protein
MSDSQFRLWMNELLSPRRELADWPQQLLWLLEMTLKSEQTVCRRYRGEKLLIDRHDLPVPDHLGEKRAAYGLYQISQEPDRQGLLIIGEHPYWLISCEVPNQTGEKGRRADLLGLSLSGGLCVFECKLGSNNYSPLTALLEGLDYLACLTCDANYSRIQEEFDILRETRDPPAGFELVSPLSTARHEVIVVADQGYYEFHNRRPLSSAWQLLNQLRSCKSLVKLAFAKTCLGDSHIYDPDNLQWCAI